MIMSEVEEENKEVPEEEETKKEQVWIHIDPLRCSGCRLCEVACSLKHENIIWPEASRIRVFEFIPAINIPTTCAQCPDYPCVKACPTDALSVDEDTGAVLVNEEKCIRCGLCIKACPGDIPRIPRGKPSVVICDLCGGEPECVKVCHEAGYNALTIVKGEYRYIYKTSLSDPLTRSKEIAKKVYGWEEW